MPGHVLHFSEVVMFEPISDGACMDFGPVPRAPQQQGTVDLLN